MDQTPPDLIRQWKLYTIIADTWLDAPDYREGSIALISHTMQRGGQMPVLYTQATKRGTLVSSLTGAFSTRTSRAPTSEREASQASMDVGMVSASAGGGRPKPTCSCTSARESNSVDSAVAPTPASSVTRARGAEGVRFVDR